MSTKAYSADGNPIEERDFGTTLNPNYATIQFLASVGCPPKRFTIREVWWGEKRVRGIYKLGTATAEVDRHMDRKPTGELFHTLDIECTNIGDGKNLYTLIRSGKILTAISYEEKQIDTPAHQLRDLIRIWWKSVLTSI